MTPVEILQLILNQYGTTIWFSFVVFVITTLIISVVKDFIIDFINYIKVKMSNLGYGAVIIWEGKKKIVEEIKFEKIKVVDDDEIVFIPIKKWIESAQTYPQPTTRTFKERKD